MENTNTTITLTAREARLLGMLSDLLVEYMDWDSMSAKDSEIANEADNVIIRLWKEGKGS